MTTYTYTVSADCSLPGTCIAEKKKMIKFTFEKVVLNCSKGWLASKRIEGVFCGTFFGKTKKEAMRASFEHSRF